ncbi:zinc finger protein ZAT9 isoform X2 [Hevea brasiliensis]|uniref:zinc finger protein ZAT9 isoform X2 n=1 Tax=Hevea brasiliensis TaxID=3981 RepID=UPI0025D7E2EE|nr:zinc finger protein ZAT9 isoform X2 [Hevea brasiliensis]
MEKNRICKICNRRFANGKAMGGHMRSHLVKLPLPPKPISSHQAEAPSSKSPSPSLSASSLNYPFSETPMQSYRSVNHQLSSISKPNFATLQDGESETESPKNATRRRSKRPRKSVEKVAESVVNVTELTEQVSSISDVAMCLLMLSRDKRTTKEVVGHYMEDEADDEYEDESFGTIRLGSKTKGKYWCDACKRSFRSYQALGGHKASHKKIKTHLKGEYEEEEGNRSGRVNDNNDGVVGIERRMFKCPFCDKIFESGQALAAEDDGEVSQDELSVVSNPKTQRN